MLVLGMLAFWSKGLKIIGCVILICVYYDSMAFKRKADLLVADLKKNTKYQLLASMVWTDIWLISDGREELFRHNPVTRGDSRCLLPTAHNTTKQISILPGM